MVCLTGLTIWKDSLMKSNYNYEKLYYATIVVWVIVFLYTLYNMDFGDSPNFDSNIYWGSINIWSSGVFAAVSVMYILFRGKLDND
jgi:hypothetical protein